MKILSVFLFALLLRNAQALPNSVFGPVALADSPLNGKDLTGELLAPPLWAGTVSLPGNWKDESHVATSDISHLLARPKLFGKEVVLLRATRREGRLVALEATFADAGSYFGYFDEKLPENLDQRGRREEVERRLATRQAEFSTFYAESLDDLRAELQRISGSARPKAVKVGHTRTLRAESTDLPVGDLTLRLLADGRRLIRITVSRSGEQPQSWLDPGIAAIPPRDRSLRLREAVRRETDGTVSIDGLQPVPQGYRPYCGLNSLAMVARYFGLSIDEDWLAAAGGFQNTGSADGSKILPLYPAVAAEAGFAVDRSSRFDEASVRRALANGFPVIVWRRFSHDRDRLHSRFMQTYARNPDSVLPDPSQPSERASWPGKDAPLHASVLTGYHDGRREFLFLESWTGNDTPRRMREEELAATAYLTFVFHP